MCAGKCVAPPENNEPPPDRGTGSTGDPDLKVSVDPGLGCDPARATISNVGDADSGPFTVGAVYLGLCPGPGSLLPPGRVYQCPGLQAGETRQLAWCETTFEFLPEAALDSCQHVGWSITVDSLESVRESRENNNWDSCSL